MSFYQPSYKLKNRVILAPYEDSMFPFLINTQSLRLLSLFWLTLKLTSFCWIWNVVEMESNSILMHLAFIHAVECISYCSFPWLCGSPLCKYTTYFFTLLLMDIWVAFPSLAILNKTAMIVLTHVFWYKIYFFFLGNVPWSRIALVHTAK